MGAVASFDVALDFEQSTGVGIGIEAGAALEATYTWMHDLQGSEIIDGLRSLPQKILEGLHGQLEKTY